VLMSGEHIRRTFSVEDCREGRTFYVLICAYRSVKSRRKSRGGKGLMGGALVKLFEKRKKGQGDRAKLVQWHSEGQAPQTQKGERKKSAIIFLQGKI